MVNEVVPSRRCRWGAELSPPSDPSYSLDIPIVTILNLFWAEDSGKHLLFTACFGQLRRWAQFGVSQILAIEFPGEPIVAKEFNRMLRPNRSVPTAEVIGSAIFVASPADSLRVSGMERDFPFRHLFFALSVASPVFVACR